jgi:hypothetical protein
MAVTYRLAPSEAVPYKTRLTGWLISENEGFGATRRTPRHFMPGFIGVFEFGTYIRTYNLFRPDLNR